MSFYPIGKKIFSDWKEILSWNIENLIRIKEKHRPRLNTPPLSKAVKSIIQIERVIRIKGTLYCDANQWFTRHGFRRALTNLPAFHSPRLISNILLNVNLSFHFTIWNVLFSNSTSWVLNCFERNRLLLCLLLVGSFQLILLLELI